MAEITSRIMSFTASDGYAFHFRAYVPHVKPKGHLVCLHGIQSHSGWYNKSCRAFAEAGYIVSYLDRRGAGLNWQKRGDTPSYRRLLDDVREFIAADGLDVPVTLIATSWAGKLGVMLAAEPKPAIDRLVLICPGLFPQVKPPLKVRLGVIVSRTTNPSKLFPIPLDDAELFTYEPQWQEFLRTDPLSIHHATARLLVESFWLDKAVARITQLQPMPALLLLAGQDRIIRNDATRSWLMKVSPQSEVLEFPSAHHTLEFEADATWLTQLVKWLNSSHGSPLPPGERGKG